MAVESNQDALTRLWANRERQAAALARSAEVVAARRQLMRGLGAAERPSGSPVSDRYLESCRAVLRHQSSGTAVVSGANDPEWLRMRRAHLNAPLAVEAAPTCRPKLMLAGGSHSRLPREDARFEAAWGHHVFCARQQTVVALKAREAVTDPRRAGVEGERAGFWHAHSEPHSGVWQRHH
eukprot:TRINITY_DN44985_c0_g1_i1.p1 TRINITY_DN44985_c0_g1~~TRINITY_DN44985_c0_g1_i1.p1  ORF type:complete len:180 (+),score=19.66 TRINITY_DN44985_c0_g1_i1:233-772(+)